MRVRLEALLDTAGPIHHAVAAYRGLRKINARISGQRRSRQILFGSQGPALPRGTNTAPNTTVGRPVKLVEV